MRLENALEQYKSIPASSEMEKKAVQAMRYDAFLAAERIHDQEDPYLSDDYDAMPHCTSYLLLEAETPIATIRHCVYAEAFDWLPIPTMEAYSEDIKRALGEGKTIVESNRFAFAPTSQKNSLLPKLLLFKNIARAAAKYDADYIITAVRPNLEGFYRKLTFFPISDPKIYPGTQSEGVLMAGEFKGSFQQLLENPVFSTVLQDCGYQGYTRKSPSA